MMDIDEEDVQILLDFVEGAAQQVGWELRDQNPAMTDSVETLNDPQTVNNPQTLDVLQDGQSRSPDGSPDLLDLLEKSLAIPEPAETRIPKPPAIVPKSFLPKKPPKQFAKPCKTRDVVEKSRLRLFSQIRSEADRLRREHKLERRKALRLEAMGAPPRTAKENNLPDPLPNMADIVWILDRKQALAYAMRYEQSLQPATGQPGVFWADGSRLKDGRSGASVAYHELTEGGSYTWTGKSYHLCPCRFVIESGDAELYAIATALEIAVNQPEAQTPIVIFSDSHQALQCIRNWKPTNIDPRSLIQTAALDAIKRVAALKAAAIDIRFIWVPGHAGVLGNDIADKMARHAAENGHGPGGVCRTEIATTSVIDRMIRSSGPGYAFFQDQTLGGQIPATQEPPRVLSRLCLEEAPNPGMLERFKVPPPEAANISRSVRANATTYLSGEVRNPYFPDPSVLQVAAADPLKLKPK